MPTVNAPLELGLRALSLVQTGALAAVGAARGLATLPSLAATLDELAARTGLIEDLIVRAQDSEELRAIPGALNSLLASTQSLQPLAAAVTELNAAVAKLNATVSPLQGTAERLGRLVDRFPARNRRELSG